jgi:hypothetical protein
MAYPMVYVVPTMATINVRSKDVEKVAKLQCTYREAAAFLGIGLNQFRNLLATNQRVKDAWERGINGGKLSLRRKQFRLAGGNASMAIFLGKQILGQRDIVTNEHTGADGGPVEIDASKLTQEARDAIRQSIVESSEPGEDAG